ncbi:DUF3106 domain-containing protein [Luteimonas abyssi]|uniref:DUF3106 domain-containing protein n=1 Tax=Luteimonas abyssi TaxID=1247514 RepID=UPI000737C6A3|nr:DUF3106 domain-containing protein [Luteimonas abyssi]
MTRDARRRRALWWAALLMVPVAVWGQALPPDLVRALEALPAGERARVQQQAQQWARLSPEQQQALRTRASEWDALPPLTRQARRASWESWQALPDDERARLRATAAAYARMSEAQRHELAERYAALDTFERDGWRLGSVLGADWPRLHGLFALVPDDQRVPLLELLRGLDDRARGDLAVIAQRTPPDERDALRRKLLSMAPQARADWLRGQASPN